MSGLKIAVLIDGENVSARYADYMFQKIAGYGDVLVKKVYVSPSLNGWRGDIVFKHAIETVVRPAYVHGKNVLDIALVLDAMDLMHVKKELINCLCIVSNDSDFALLAMRLREDDIKVIGFGEKNKAVDSFVNACDNFVYFERMHAVKKSPRILSPIELVKHDSIKSARKILTDAVNVLARHADNSGWLNLSRVMDYVKEKNPDFDVRAYGCGQLKELVNKTGVFDINIGEDGFIVYIKLKKRVHPILLLFDVCVAAVGAFFRSAMIGIKNDKRVAIGVAGCLSVIALLPGIFLMKASFLHFRIPVGMLHQYIPEMANVWLNDSCDLLEWKSRENIHYVATAGNFWGPALSSTITTVGDDEYIIMEVMYNLDDLSSYDKRELSRVLIVADGEIIDEPLSDAHWGNHYEQESAVVLMNKIAAAQEVKMRIEIDGETTEAIFGDDDICRMKKLRDWRQHARPLQT